MYRIDPINIWIFYVFIIGILIIVWAIYKKKNPLPGTKPINWVLTTQDNTANTNILYSSDGENYNDIQGQLLETMFSGAYGLTEDKKNFIWLVGADSNQVSYSYNANTWITNTTILAENRDTDYGYDADGNSRWLATGSTLVSTDPSQIFSSDGIVWQNCTGASFNVSGYAIKYGRDFTDTGVWVATGQDTGGGNNNILYSFDDMVWKVSDGVSFTGTGDIYGNSIDYGTSSDRETPRWVTVGTGSFNMLYSDNGISWNYCTGASFSEGGTGNDVAFGRTIENNPMWVVAGGNPDINPNTLLYSYDGVSWDVCTGASFAGGYGYAVNFGKNNEDQFFWVAIGSDDGDIPAGKLLFSFDGISWFIKNEDFSQITSENSYILSNILSQSSETIFD